MIYVYEDMIIDEDWENEKTNTSPEQVVKDDKDVNINFYVENQTYNAVDICKEYIHTILHKKLQAKKLNDILVEKGILTVHNDTPKYRLADKNLGVVYEKAVRYNKQGLIQIHKILTSLGYDFVKGTNYYKNVFQMISDSPSLSNVSDICKEYTNVLNAKLFPNTLNNILKSNNVISNGVLCDEYKDIGETHDFKKDGQINHFVKYNKFGRFVIFYLLLNYGYYPANLDSKEVSKMINAKYFDSFGVDGLAGLYNNGLFNYNNIEKFIEDVYVKEIHYVDLVKFYKHSETDELLTLSDFLRIMTSNICGDYFEDAVLINGNFTNEYKDCGNIIGRELYINDKGLRVIHDKLLKSGYVLNVNYNLG